MVPVEGKESGELHPPVTEFLIRVALEPTRIRSDEWNLEDLELEHALDAEVHVAPLADIVPQPVASPLARAGESRPANDERTLARVDVEQRKVRRLLFHESP